MRCTWRLLSAFGAVLLLLSGEPIRAWNDRGHMLVAFIAFRHLQPEVRKEVGRLLTLNPEYKSWLKGVPATATAERRALIAFQHASVWPDFIKGAPGYVADGSNGGNTPPPGPSASQNIGYADRNQHRYWHFINVPLSDDGTPTQDPPAVNAGSQIEILRKALASPAASDDVKSYDLAWLAHLVGDVHQPLHAVSRFVKTDLDGDRGGNDVRVTCAASLQCEANLHAQWDGLLGSNTLSSSIASAGAMLDSGPPPAGAANPNVADWIQEGVAIARASVYQTPWGTPLGSPEATLSAEYVRRSRSIARQRVRLAGYRLAALVNGALEQPSLRRSTDAR